MRCWRSCMGSARYPATRKKSQARAQPKRLSLCGQERKRAGGHASSIVGVLLHKRAGSGWPFLREAGKEEFGFFRAAGTVVDGDLMGLGGVAVAFPQRDPRVGAVFSEYVVSHVHEAQVVLFAAVVVDDALEVVHSRLFRRHSPAHVFDDGVGSGNFDVLFAAAGGAGGADVLIGVTSGADDGRVSATARQLPRQTAGGGAARDLSFFIQRRTVNGAGGRMEDFADGVHAFGFGD